MSDEAPARTLDPDQSGSPTFSVGPPEAVTDSRLLPAVSPEDEAGSVHGADIGDDHPDNRDTGSTDPDVLELEPDADADEDLPSEDELAAALLSGVDLTTVDEVGFDEGDEALFEADSGDSQIGVS